MRCHRPIIKRWLIAVIMCRIGFNCRRAASRFQKGSQIRVFWNCNITRTITPIKRLVTLSANSANNNYITNTAYPWIVHHLLSNTVSEDSIIKRDTKICPFGKEKFAQNDLILQTWAENFATKSLYTSCIYLCVSFIVFTLPYTVKLFLVTYNCKILQMVLHFSHNFFYIRLILIHNHLWSSEIQRF